MLMRRESITYYFSVEGETEKWYLEWLQNSLNAEPDIPCAVKFVSKIQKNPLQYTKGLNIIQKTEITHLFDYEGGEDCVSNFQNILSLMKNAQTSKSITYRCGYCNFTFELWMVLHKADCNGLLANRYQYLPLINRVYDEHFENLDHFKREDNFKRVLLNFRWMMSGVRLKEQKTLCASMNKTASGCSNIKVIDTIEKIRPYQFGRQWKK